MCNPMMIAGLVLTAGSIAANSAAASQANKAREGAMTAERIRQKGYQQEADALNQDAQSQYQDFGTKQETKAGQLADYYQGQQAAAPLPDSAVPTSASNITVQEEAKQRDAAKDYTDKTGAALGQLRAFGDVMADTGRVQARDASQIGQIGGFMRGSQGVLPYELEAASHKGDGLRTAGSIMGAVGSMLTMGSLMAPAGAANAAAGAGTAAGIGSNGGALYSLYQPGTTLGAGAAAAAPRLGALY